MLSSSVPANPQSPPRGGGKRGTWDLKPDGSGTWTRIDRTATRYRTLYRSGPARSEVVLRETFDANSGEMLGTPMRDYSTAKELNAELPEPTPRHIRTVFHFRHTAARIPAEVIAASKL